MLHPAGPAAQTIAEVWWIMLAGATAIFAVVMVLLLVAFRHRPAAPPATAPADAVRTHPATCPS